MKESIEVRYEHTFEPPLIRSSNTKSRLLTPPPVIISIFPIALIFKFMRTNILAAIVWDEGPPDVRMEVKPRVISVSSAEYMCDWDGEEEMMRSKARWNVQGRG